MKKIKIYMIVSLIVFVGLITYLYYPKEEPEYHKSSLEFIEIKIQGAVINEGIYFVPNNITLGNLIDLAGGLSINADLSLINYHEIVESKTYYIAYIQTGELEDEYKIKYDLNTVTYEQLITIPNITSNRALGILMYRRDKGAFYSLDELLEVSGIGTATYEKIKGYFFI